MRNILFILSACMVLYSCSNSEEKIQERWSYFLEHGAKDSLLIKEIYQTATDTINNWIEADLRSWAFRRYKKYKQDYKLFPWFFVNTNKDQAVGYFPERSLYATADHDDIRVIMGEKYKGVWRFFTNVTYHIPREDKEHRLPSFEYLHFRCYRLAMGWYYKEERKSFSECAHWLWQWDYPGYQKCTAPKYTINDRAFEVEFKGFLKYNTPKKRWEDWYPIYRKNREKYTPEDEE